MNRIEHLLTVLMEECAEVQQACAKALRFGLQDGYPRSGTTNAEDIEKEFLEALAVRDLLRDAQALSRNVNATSIYSDKRRRVSKFMEYAESRGTLLQGDSTAARTPLAEPRKVELINSTVADYYDIPIKALYSSSRRTRYVLPRWVGMSIARDLLSLSFPDLGDAFNRDHTSVMNGISKLQEIRQQNSEVEHDYQILIDELSLRVTQYDQKAKSSN